MARYAATQTDSPVPGLEEILLRLSDTDDRFGVWEVSVALARRYGRSCPRGEDLGLVKHLVDQRGGDILLLTDEDETAGHPRAAVLRPAVPDVLWDDSAAWEWTNRLVPQEIRGELVSRHSEPGSDGDGDGDEDEYRFASDVFVFLYGNAGLRRWRRVEIVANGVYETWDMELPLQGHLRPDLESSEARERGV